MAGTVTVGEFVAFGVYLAMLVWPMIALGWAVNLVQRGAASMGRINQLFRERAGDRRARRAARRCRPARGGRAVEFADVWFTYPGARDRGCGAAGRLLPGRGRDGRSPSSGRPARASPRWWTCWCAPTTRTAGAVLLDGVDIRRLPLAELRARGRLRARRRPSSSARRSGTTCCSARPTTAGWSGWRRWPSSPRRCPPCPNGFDTMLGERGINLSRRPEAAARDRAGAGAGPAGVRARRRAERGGRAHRGARSSARCAARSRGAPASSSPTASRPCATRTGSWCWTRAGSWRRAPTPT